ncbi:MAG: hypothetical protein ABH821_03165 [archaeon]
MLKRFMAILIALIILSFVVPTVFAQECGDNVCEGDEETTCPDDCVSPPDPDPFCGDGMCNGSEDSFTCEPDCGPPPVVCGDGRCDEGEMGSCDLDCGPTNYCGDGRCDNDESQENCSTDCGEPPEEAFCGDGRCNGNETQDTCQDDCGRPPGDSYCGNGVCETGEENGNCPIDCFYDVYCGDGQCNGSETQDTCSRDCGMPPDDYKGYCGDKQCNPEYGENEQNCHDDCGYPDNDWEEHVCGDGVCESSEDKWNCHDDCGFPDDAGNNYCGDGECKYWEDKWNCSMDCGMPDEGRACKSEEEIRRMIEQCNQNGSRGETRHDQMTGCPVIECIQEQKGIYDKPIMPGGNGCIEERDQKTGAVKVICNNQQQCPIIYPEEQEKCHRSGGEVEYRRDQRGCEFLECNYGSRGFIGGTCPSEQEKDNMLRECENQNLKPIVERGFNGCEYVKCGGFGSESTGNYDCRPPPFEEVRRIEESCRMERGRIIQDFDETGCSKPKCVSGTYDKFCAGEVPEEAVTKCEQAGGEFIKREGPDGCIEFADCIMRKDGAEYGRVNKVLDSTELIQLAFKLEELGIEFDRLISQAEELARYYGETGDTESKERLTKVASMFRTAKEKLGEIKIRLRDSIDNPTLALLTKVKNDIREVKEVIIADALYLMLGGEIRSSSTEAKVDEQGITDCGTDEGCFTEMLRTCNKASVTHYEYMGPVAIEFVASITGIDDFGKCELDIRGDFGAGNVYQMSCHDPSFASGQLNDDFETYCSGDLLIKMEELEMGPKGPGGPDDPYRPGGPDDPYGPGGPDDPYGPDYPGGPNGPDYRYPDGPSGPDGTGGSGYGRGQESFCGDGDCKQDLGESSYTCPQDCGYVNGSEPGEDSYCGDGVCKDNEDSFSCPNDCGEPEIICGDGICYKGEMGVCDIDCGPKDYCGDGICGADENQQNCATDCGEPAYCGDGACDASESQESCPKDCGEPPGEGDQ